MSDVAELLERGCSLRASLAAELAGARPRGLRGLAQALSRWGEDMDALVRSLVERDLEETEGDLERPCIWCDCCADVEEYILVHVEPHRYLERCDGTIQGLWAVLASDWARRPAGDEDDLRITLADLDQFFSEHPELLEDRDGDVFAGVLRS